MSHSLVSRIHDFKSGTYAQYELTVKLEHFLSHEITLMVKEDGKLLIEASYEVDHPEYGLQTHLLVKQVTLPANIDPELMRCRFNQKTGILVVFIPITKILDAGWKVIPIQFEHTKGPRRVKGVTDM